MPSLQSVWNTVAPVRQAVESAWHAFLRMPHHAALGVGICGVLVVLLIMAIAMRGRAPETLSLNQPSAAESRSSRRRAAFDQTPDRTTDEPFVLRNRFLTPSGAPGPNVTPIDRAPATRCTHCEVPMPARSSFCPVCGYAQPPAPEPVRAVNE